MYMLPVDCTPWCSSNSGVTCVSLCGTQSTIVQQATRLSGIARFSVGSQVEQRLKQDHKTAMEELTSEHADRNQEMLGRFDCAQSLMKNKISELQDL